MSANETLHEEIVGELRKLSAEHVGNPMTFAQVVARTAFWSRVFVDAFGSDEQAIEVLALVVASTQSHSTMVGGGGGTVH